MLENSNQVDQDALNSQDRELPRENQQPPMDEDKVEKILGVVMGNRKEIVNKVHQIPRGLIIDVADGPVLTLDSDEGERKCEGFDFFKMTYLSSYYITVMVAYTLHGQTVIIFTR